MDSNDPSQANQDMTLARSGSGVPLPSIRSLLEELERDDQQQPEPTRRSKARLQRATTNSPPSASAPPHTRSPLPSARPAERPYFIPHINAPSRAPQTTLSRNYPQPVQPSSSWPEGPPPQPRYPLVVGPPEPSSSISVPRPTGSTSSLATFQSSSLPWSYNKSHSFSFDHLPRRGLHTSITSDSSQDGSLLDGPDYSPSLRADFTLRPIANRDRPASESMDSPASSSFSDESIDGTQLENELPFRLRPVVFDDSPPSPAGQSSRSSRKGKAPAVPAPCIPGKLTKNGRPYSRARPDELKVQEAQPNGRKTWTQTEKAIAWEALREYQRQNPGFDPRTSKDEDQRRAYPAMWKWIMHRLPKRTYDGFLTWASKHWRRPTTRSKSRAAKAFQPSTSA